MKLTYSIFYPGGNTTALVNQLIVDPILKRKINDKIMTINPQVEQVGFLDQNSNRLEMAGGEFCGNATRCSAFYYLKGQPGKIKLKVSSVSKKLPVGIDTKKNVWAQMPLQVNPINQNRGYTEINFEGITQIVIPGKGDGEKAEFILKKMKLIDSVASAGVMFFDRKSSKITLNPFVWARDVNTFFNETACGSGTAAVGLTLARQFNRSIDLAVIQPSKKIIKVSVKLGKINPPQVFIKSPISLIKKNLILKI